MSILNIRKAVRAGSKVVIGIAGQSGSGKTYTALQIARGMVENASEIGFLDTENRRGSLYADKLDAPFLIGDLYAPFSPSRYSDAIKEFQDAGVKLLVIDSVSHEWEQGCMEIAEAPLLRGKKMADWKLAKSEHKKFMSVLLQSDMHIICCIRAAEKTDFSDPRKPVSMGICEIQEKNFMFEMTASVMMFNEGLNQQHLKVPQDLKPIFGEGNNYLGIETGKGIIDWVNSGDVDSELESWRNKMQIASTGGTDNLKKEWLTMPKSILPKMKQYWNSFEASAKAIDQQNNQFNELPQDAKPFQPAQEFKPETVTPAQQESEIDNEEF